MSETQQSICVGHWVGLQYIRSPECTYVDFSCSERTELRDTDLLIPAVCKLQCTLSYDVKSLCQGQYSQPIKNAWHDSTSAYLGQNKYMPRETSMMGLELILVCVGCGERNERCGLGLNGCGVGGCQRGGQSGVLATGPPCC
jgi:hypothetical protein